MRRTKTTTNADTVDDLAKALSEAEAKRDLGHSSITITLDRYGHLMPGNEDRAAALLDAYLLTAARSV
jgi:integrase